MTTEEVDSNLVFILIALESYVLEFQTKLFSIFSFLNNYYGENCEVFLKIEKNKITEKLYPVFYSTIFSSELLK